MIKKIIKNINTQSNIKLISPIDEIKLALKSDILYNIIHTYKSKDSIEKYVQKLLLAKESNVMDIILDNYFNNLLNSIYFIIGNPFSIDSKIFDIIYQNRHLISNIPSLITNNYDIFIYNEEYTYISDSIKKKLHQFYNYNCILRWYNTVIPKKLDKKSYFKMSSLSIQQKKDKWDKYNLIWDEYISACIVMKKYIKKLLVFYKPLKIKSVGCSILDKKYYLYQIESYLGLKVDINKLEKWALHDLNRLINQMKTYLKIVYPNINLNNNFKTLLNKLSQDNNNKFKSKNELIQLYTNIINKYKKIYVDILKFSEYDNVNLVIFDNKSLGGGYYYLNNFYLNINNYQKMYKHTVESLVLHETIPGHHLQINNMLNTKNKYNLLFGYFNSSTIGFIEGWGLFSEKLGFQQTALDKIGQLEYEIYRTLRIIIDIGIHYHGKSPDEMSDFMEQHLTMSRTEIENEIYRYVCTPGQAIAYKVGDHIFHKILQKNNITDVLDPNAIQLYKQLIKNGPKPLKFICKDYNITSLFDI